MSAGGSVVGQALRCLLEADPDAKCRLTDDLAARIAAGDFDPHSGPLEPAAHSIAQPGRPARPLLVLPRALPQRKLSTIEGRAALLHAVAHIEFNAINLAWDAVYRFRGLPPEYVADWASVAADEARHFLLVRERLRQLGHDYGDFPAHDGLWQMALATEDHVRARMALVPRVLEARGLDVTPGMIERLQAAGDRDSCAVLELILREEVRHVEIGSRWFHHACARDGIGDPRAEFFALLQSRAPGRVRPPFNVEARRRAGFDEAELERIVQGV